jgi:hypothetical protein
MFQLLRSVFSHSYSYRGAQESENTTDLAVGEMVNGAGPSTNVGLGLGVQGAKIGMTIKSFDDACVYFSPSFIFPINLSLLCRWRLDIQNERLPKFNPDIAPTM